MFSLPLLLPFYPSSLVSPILSCPQQALLSSHCQFLSPRRSPWETLLIPEWTLSRDASCLRTNAFLVDEDDRVVGHDNEYNYCRSLDGED